MTKQTVGWIVGVFIIFPLFVFLYNKITVRKNDGMIYYDSFMSRIVNVKLWVPSNDGDGLPNVEANYDSYRVGASPVGFKGIAGSIQTVTFYDKDLEKYFIVYLLDVSSQKYGSIRGILRNNELNALVNQDDLHNPSYGTKQKPIPIFNFNGVNEPIRVGSDNPGSVDGWVNLEPTEKEYKHNVLTYLTYIMPKQEFEQRFEGKK